MRIAAITLHGTAGWPTLKLDGIGRGLNAFCSPPRTGKTLSADLAGQTLFGKPPAPSSQQGALPPGEVVVESERGRLRVRRYRDADGVTRFTVAALDGSAVDERTMRTLVGGLSPTVLAPLCAVSFRDPPDINRLLAAEFAREIHSIGGGSNAESSRRTAELAARRDALAQELETRIADQRRRSHDMEARSRELERALRDQQQQTVALEQRLRAVETSLTETDARLRYRRLELNVALRWTSVEPPDGEPRLDELDQQVARSRTMLAEFAQREAGARARLAQIQSLRGTAVATAPDQRVWLAMARQLSADLAGEVARLARASASQQCVCRDAHPRLRPIAETIERQLDVLETMVDEQQRANAAAELQLELSHLCGVQAELQRHLDVLLDRRQALAQGAATQREDASAGRTELSAVDAQQLELRHLELEQERFGLVDQIKAGKRTLRDLRARCETVNRQRAALLSARSIDHVQRELATVQQKLEHAVGAGGQPGEAVPWDDHPLRASDFLAQLTDDSLVRLELVGEGRRARVVNRAGETLLVETLTADQRDQVYLSLCLALLSAASRYGVWLPLVLDEPFARLDAHATAALAAVLSEFTRQGHQVLVFTAQQAAAERLASLGAAVCDIAESRRQPASPTTAPAPDQRRVAQARPTHAKKRKAKRRNANHSDAA